MEDSFDYREAKINESIARDMAAQQVGELVTLWKNEFKALVQSRRAHAKDSAIGRLRRQHRIIGQKILNFVFNMSRRALLVYEGKVDALRQREGSSQQQDSHEHPSGPKATLESRQPAEPSRLISYQKDHAGMNVLLALVLYNCTISSYNQVEPGYADIEEEAETGSQDDSSESDEYAEEAKASE
jgi:hypothetical protein